MQIESKNSQKILTGTKFPVYLLNGSEEFLLKELADELVDFLIGSGEEGDAVLRYDSASAGVADILNGIFQPQMFSPMTVAVVENAQEMALDEPEDTAKKSKKGKTQKNQHEWERFQRWLSSPPEDMRVVLIAYGEMKYKKTGKAFVERAYIEIEKTGCVVNFPRMYDDGVARWLAGRAEKAGLKMSIGRAEYMIMLAGRDLRHLANELEKLELYCGKGGEVDEEAIEALATSGEEELVFKLVDAVFNGRQSDAERLLEEIKKSGLDPLKVIGNLTANIRSVWQARLLLEKGYLRNLPKDYRSGGFAAVKSEVMRISDDVMREISEDAAKSIVRKVPFVVHKCVWQARKLKIELLERWMYYCARADRALKGVDRGAGPDDVVFDRLIAGMLREVRPKASPR